MTAKEAKQRQKEWRDRVKADAQAQGLKQVRSLWAHPEDHAAIREHAARLARKRAKKEQP